MIVFYRKESFASISRYKIIAIITSFVPIDVCQ